MGSDACRGGEPHGGGFRERRGRAVVDLERMGGPPRIALPERERLGMPRAVLSQDGQGSRTVGTRWRVVGGVARKGAGREVATSGRRTGEVDLTKVRDGRRSGEASRAKARGGARWSARRAGAVRTT